jgi:pyruvate/2-oxoglutarate dehydrogenase complex dihydrolipoamide dehydrogenase (E3) component
MKLLILGGGPAGLNAAVRGRSLGAAVTVIERNRVGGISLNEGPAPVRTLARAARLMRDVQLWPTFGLSGPAPRLNVAAALANARRVAHYAHTDKRVDEQLRSLGVELIEGSGDARFVDPHTIATPDGRTWQGDRVVIAAGGHARHLSIPGAELGLVYTDVRTLTALPQRIAIVGGADTGCQLASILADFGSEVLILERSQRLNQRADQDISQALTAAFAQRGIQVVTDASAERLVRGEAGVQLHYRVGDAVRRADVDAVFFAVGWPGNLDGLNLGAAGVTAERGFIPVNDWLQTNVPHIFAVGDINGRSMLVPSARHEGRISAENAVRGNCERVAHSVVATGSFTDPEYGSVGLTETQARESADCVSAVVHYDVVPRAVIDSRTDGFCKLVVDRKSHLLLGAHVLGEYSAEIIQVAAVCMTAKMRVEELAAVQLAFPTFTEALGMAAQRIVRELGLVHTFEFREQ